MYWDCSHSQLRLGFCKFLLQKKQSPALAGGGRKTCSSLTFHQASLNWELQMFGKSPSEQPIAEGISLQPSMVVVDKSWPVKQGEQNSKKFLLHLFCACWN